MRLEEHPILEFDRGKEIKFFYNGKPIIAYEGETVASALHAAGIRVLSHSVKGRPRGFFCGIGKCSACMMRVDGVPNVRTCVTTVKDGMKVESQDRLGEIGDSTDWPSKKILETVDMLVVGGGPAGLTAAITAANAGASVLVVDDNPRIGGQLIKQTHRFFGSSDQNAGVRGIDIAAKLLGELDQLIENGQVELLTNTTAIGYFRELKDDIKKIRVVLNRRGETREVISKTLVVATGARENMLAFPNNDLPGIYGAGGVQTLLNVYGVKPGDSVLMVGAGNVGLIVSYQLIQAGVKVKAVVEAMPKIGGYLVHAAKLRRMGVPIYTRHSIKKAYGTDRVEGAIIGELDDNWNFKEGTDMDIKCDVICLAVGLTPSVELLEMAGCKVEFIPELGGYVALHDPYMETTVPGIYVCGDDAGIEEASAAIMEGRIAGAAAALKMGIGDANLLKETIDETSAELASERAGPFGARIRNGLKKMAAMLDEGAN